MELDFSKALFCAVDKLYTLRYGVSEDMINNLGDEVKVAGDEIFSAFDKKLKI